MTEDGIEWRRLPTCVTLQRRGYIAKIPIEADKDVYPETTNKLMIQPSQHPPKWLLLLLALFALSACEFPRVSDPLPATELAAQTAVPAATTSAATATPLPPSPTRPATPLPQPSVTPDPDLADWTVMVYLDADNNLELSGLRDLNEMEAAGNADSVNVLVQMDRALAESEADGDWTGARRYLVTADKDPNRIASEPVAALDEVNMGDPQVLADFLAWGINNYPANHYALVLWDHGAGWNGIAFDGDVGFGAQVDHISLPDLKQALANGLDQTNRSKIDLIGFDACLMGQLDVLQAIQPFAEFAVASEELTPAQGWDYASLLGHLYDDPAQGGAELARQVVDDFIDYYSESEPEDFVTLSAVDLAKLPDLTYAVEELASALTANPTFVTSAIGDARSGAEAYARVYADEFDQYAAIDLNHFASILAQRSPDDQVIRAAEQVIAATSLAVIHNRTGVAFRNSGGISLYFPRTASFYAPAYGEVTAMAGWDEFLRTYHDTSLADLPPPQITLSRPVSATVGTQAPLYLEFEVIGREIADVSLVGGRYRADGRELLLEYDHLIPEPTYLADGSQLVEWRDGLHEDFFVWDSRVTYLFDVEGNGDYVVMWPTDYGSSLFTVQGRYRRANGQDYFDANLVFDHHDGKMTQVWSQQNQAAAELSPQPGDEFQLFSYYRSADGSLTAEAGASLFFDELRQLYFDWRPLPDGNYFLGFEVENAAGETADALVDLSVDNEQNEPGYTAYLDPYLGFQFNYPESWFRPIYEDTLLYTTNSNGTTQLQITAFPNLKRGENAISLRTQALDQFGPIELLYPTENVIVAGTTGLRTVYGYQKPDGELRSGIFLTFVVDGTGYVVDVDGPIADEAATIATVNALSDSWQVTQARFGLYPGDWATVDLNAFSVAQPADFRYQEVNGWQRFSSDSRTFVALRSLPATLEASEVLAALNRDAAAGVTNYLQHDPLQLSLAGKFWLRSDFSYQVGSDEIWGFIMVSVQAGQEIVAWAEAPATHYNQLESDVFLMMIADLTLAE